MQEYDEAILQCFLEKQLQLFPEKVADSEEEAQEFLEDCMAVVVNTIEEIREYFEEEGIDLENMDDEELLQAEEVFDVGDGRYLIVEA